MENTTSSYGRPKVASLDLLRGIAALMVAVGHFGPLGAIDLGRTFALCVPFFFMLSGFVLEHAYGDKIRSGTETLGSYALRRFARLYPLHLLTMMAVLAFWGAVAIARTVVALPIADFVGLEASPVQWIESLTLTHFLFGGGVAFNTPSWSISVELWGSFYVFALCLIPRWIVLAFVLPAVSVAFLLIEINGGLLAGPRLAFGVLDKVYPIGVFCFTVGWLLKAYWAEIGQITRRVPDAAWWAASTAVFAAVAIDPFGPMFDAGYCAAFAVVIAGMASVTASHPAMLSLGAWSYGIYLWHMPVILCMTAVVKLLASRGLDLTGNPLLDVVFIAAVLGVSAAGYRWVEVPAKNWLTSPLRRRHPAAA